MQKNIITTKQAILKMVKSALQLKKRNATTVRSGIERMLKEAAVSWKAMAFPQLSRAKIVVRRGMTLGKYMPAPSPTNKVATAKEG